MTEKHDNAANIAGSRASTDAIQVDMFEVQLGAAVLLQFRNDKGLVCVLADAGVRAGSAKSKCGDRRGIGPGSARGRWRKL